MLLERNSWILGLNLVNFESTDQPSIGNWTVRMARIFVFLEWDQISEFPSPLTASPSRVVEFLHITCGTLRGDALRLWRAKAATPLIFSVLWRRTRSVHELDSQYASVSLLSRA
jgi:hypothetical protein